MRNKQREFLKRIMAEEKKSKKIFITNLKIYSRISKQTI